jgi:hypothetical protein
LPSAAAAPHVVAVGELVDGALHAGADRVAGLPLGCLLLGADADSQVTEFSRGKAHVAGAVAGVGAPGAVWAGLALALGPGGILPAGIRSRHVSHTSGPTVSPPHSPIATKRVWPRFIGLLDRRSLEELPGRLEAQPFVHRHCLAAGVDRHAKGPAVCRMLRSSLHERRADPLASMPRQDENALDVCGQPTCRPRSRHARDERHPGHADDLRSEGSSHERQVRVPVGGPPPRELRCECVNGPLCWLLMMGVQPQQPGQVRNVVRIRLTDHHDVGPATVWSQ